MAASGRNDRRAIGCSTRGCSLAFLLAVLSLVGCGGGGGDGFGCTGRTCTATFQGAGEQDLSSSLGDDATVEVLTLDVDSVTARIAAQDVTLAKGRTQRVAGYDVTLTTVDGEDVSLRIVGD